MVARNTDLRRLFTERTDSYLRFIRSVGYPQGLRAYCAHSPLLRYRYLDVWGHVVEARPSPALAPAPV